MGKIGRVKMEGPAADDEYISGRIQAFCLDPMLERKYIIGIRRIKLVL